MYPYVFIHIYIQNLFCVYVSIHTYAEAWASVWIKDGVITLGAEVWYPSGPAPGIAADFSHFSAQFEDFEVLWQCLDDSWLKRGLRESLW